jgi:hypothetical protein
MNSLQGRAKVQILPQHHVGGNKKGEKNVVVLERNIQKEKLNAAHGSYTVTYEWLL